MRRYALRTGEPLAISADAIRRDADGFFILLGGEPPENETRGSVIVVNVRGALQQFRGPEGDSYEAITARVGAAFAADPLPSAVLLRISSPGGVVAGLNECVLRLQRMSKSAKIPLVAYADELAASAAYALCCACSEILVPPSGIVGSVGVISTMISIAKRDEKDGIEFRIITSGKRKADGHVHVPISDDAVKAETARNAEMAAQFFALAGKARRLPPAKLEALEAAIFMGKAATKVGLADDVIGLDDVLLGLDTTEVASSEAVAPNGGNVTDRRACEAPKTAQNARNGAKVDRVGRSVSHQTSAGERPMSVKLSALIKKTESAIAAESDPKKLRSLQANLAAYLTARAGMDDDDGDDDGDDGGDDDGDESKAKKAAESARKAKAKAESAKHRAKAAEHKQKAAEYEEAAKKCEEEASGSEEEEEEEEEESEEEEARLRVGPARALTPGAAAALASQGDVTREALTRIGKLEKAAEARELSALINDARAARRITPGEAKKLEKKTAGFVRDFLEMRPKPLVNIDEEAAHVPDGTPAGDLSPLVMKEIEKAIVSCNLDEKGQAKMRADLIEEHRKARMNGAGTRY